MLTLKSVGVTLRGVVNVTPTILTLRREANERTGLGGEGRFLTLLGEDGGTVLTVHFHHDGESGHSEQVSAVTDVLFAGLTVSDMLDMGAVVDIEQLLAHFNVHLLSGTDVVGTQGFLTFASRWLCYW